MTVLSVGDVVGFDEEETRSMLPRRPRVKSVRQRVRVLHVIPSVDISQGGPSYSTVNLCRALADQGITVGLFTTEPRGAVPAATGKGFSVSYFTKSFPRRYGNSNHLVRAVRSNLVDYDLLHLTSVWNFLSTRVARAAHSMNIPYVLTPRGMLSAWSRSVLRPDKELYFALRERKTVNHAAALHFLTAHEASSSAHAANGTPQCILPNGVCLEEFESADPQGFRERFNVRGNRIVMFLGRLHRIKRLDVQCEAFTLLSKKFPDLRWVFVGPDDGVMNALIGRLHVAGLEKKAVFTGLLSGKDRISALAAADVYCHTSDHEGHSVAITEALAAGKPCVVTEGCNFDMLERGKAGFVVSSSPKQIAAAIEQILSNSPLSLDMQRNAKKLVHDNFTWSRLATAMIDFYKWVLGRGPRPNCVQTS